MEVIFKSWLAAGTANAVTTSLLHPLDRLRVVQQLQAPARGFLRTLAEAHAASGLRGLWLPGLQASIYREYLYSGPRIGLYVPCRDALEALTGASKTSVALKVLAGVGTGLVGCLIANPVDVVKVRLMHSPAAYPSTLAALPLIFRREGFLGLYKGLVPSTLRGVAITVGQIVTYDIAKGHLQHTHTLPEGPVQHVAASVIAGLCATVLSAPFDLIKTRAMASAEKQETVASVVRSLWREGALPGSLFRGIVPAYLRQGPFLFICLPLMEQLRAALGLPFV